MKKVLIISYFFPPCNFVGAERTAAWAKYLNEFGYYPIIITRCWNEGQTNLLEKARSNVYSLEKFDAYEIHQVPVKRTLRDRCSGIKWLAPIQKSLTFLEILLNNYLLISLPYYSIYQKARELLNNDKEINVVIASGRPFQTFFIGSKLRDEFDVRWLPDYRDEWNSHQNPTTSSILWRFISNLERKSELRWTSNADGFITVSQNWRSSIQNFIQKKGFVVMNGYHEILKPIIKETDETRLKILYAGTLYPSQKIDFLINAVKQIPNFEDKILVEFVGVNIIPSELTRLKGLCKGSSVFRFVDRVNRENLTKAMQLSDILILTSFDNVKGWYPVKLFEYYASGKPILLCPSDKDVMEEFVLKTNSGFVANTVEECEAILRECLAKKQNGEIILFERNLVEGEKYSRRYQTKILAEHLDSIYNK